MILFIILVVLAVLVGVIAGIQTVRQRSIITASETGGGWVYFLSTKNGEFDDPPSPIKIGMTHRDPTVDRLPEIETMSPDPLYVLYTFHTKQPALMEHAIHQELASFRRHGEWFDRDATLAWLDHHRETYA